MLWRAGLAGAAVTVLLTACSSGAAPPKELGEFVVFMQPHATAAQTTTVRRYLARSPRVDRVRFISKRAAYAEFRRIEGRERADLVNTITPADLPASFDAFARTRGNARALARRLHHLPGVDQVATAPPARELRRTCRILKGARNMPTMYDAWCRPYR